MSILIDTGVFYAHQDQDARDHETARRAIQNVFTGRWGRVFTSDYVLDETITLTLRRTRSHAQAMTVANRILGHAGYPRHIEVLMTTGPSFREALKIFEQYHDQDLSFTDATIIALVRRRGIDHVLSFDSDFDGIIDRLEPATI